MKNAAFSTSLITTTGLVASAICIGLSLVIAAGRIQTGITTAATSTVTEVCLQVASGKEITTGTSDTSDWTVEAPTLDQVVLNTCLEHITN